MTLHKAIVAAREALDKAGRQFRFYQGEHLGRGIPEKATTNGNYGEICEIGLSTLPAKPMSEDEIVKLACDKWVSIGIEKMKAGLQYRAEDIVKDIIRALRDAGVLYVEENK